jgi:hypothetical protein
MKKIDEEMIEINGQIAAIMRTAWLERKHEIQSYLLAAAAIVAAEDSARRGAGPKPDSFGLDSSTVERWVEALKRAEKEPDNLFYPLARLAKPLPAGEQETTFAERVAEMHGELQEWTAKADPNHPANKERGDIVFADFEGADYGDWRASGAAFGESPSRYHAPNLALAGYQGNGIANSFAGGSDEWTGTLTSKSFAMEKPYLHVRLAGSERRTNRVVYGELFFALVTSGRFRSLTADGSGALQWRTTDVKRTPGQVSYIEIVDRARDAHIVVDKIIFSDSNEPPVITSAPNRASSSCWPRQIFYRRRVSRPLPGSAHRVLAAPSDDETDKWLGLAQPRRQAGRCGVAGGRTKRSTSSACSPNAPSSARPRFHWECSPPTICPATRASTFAAVTRPGQKCRGALAVLEDDNLRHGSPFRTCRTHRRTRQPADGPRDGQSRWQYYFEQDVAGR